MNNIKEAIICSSPHFNWVRIAFLKVPSLPFAVAFVTARFIPLKEKMPIMAERDIMYL